MLSGFRKSFSSRVFITVAAFVIIFSTVCSGWFISTQKKALEDKLNLEGKLVSELLASNVRIGIFAENESLIKPYAETVLAHQNVISVSVFNADGKTILHMTKDDGINEYAADYSKTQQYLAKIKADRTPFHAENGTAAEFWAPVSANSGYVSDTFPTQNTGRLLGFVSLTLSRKVLIHDMELLFYKSILTTLFFLLLGLSITLAFIRQILLPVGTLMKSVRNLGDASLPEKIPVLSSDEFGQLAASFNGMIDRLQMRQQEKERLESQLLHNHKMDVIGCLAADISNDFNSLVDIFASKISLAKTCLSPGHMAYEELNKLSDSIGYAREITRKLSEFSKNTPVFMTVQSVGDFLNEALPLLTLRSSLQLNLLIDDGIRPCKFDKWQINRVIGSILDNSKESSPIGGTITISVKNTNITGHVDMSDGHYVMISIADQGIGISPENIKKIFMPFFTTKYKHYGLGLAMAFSIMKHHGGHIEAHSEEGKGAVINLYFPSVG
ncbi:MAG: ATP-binding protein [Candidatus Magnetominusculus sp. LBB02]|nr:ATP-binding protein [Candidatus Magnetominusculus sp. LBB02]